MNLRLFFMAFVILFTATGTQARERWAPFSFHERVDPMTDETTWTILTHLYTDQPQGRPNKLPSVALICFSNAKMKMAADFGGGRFPRRTNHRKVKVR